MGYPTKLLAPGESIKFQMRPHWRALIWPIIALLINAFLGIFLLVITPWTWLKWVIGAAMVFFLVWPSLVYFLRWITTDYVFTDRRVIVRSGLLTKSGRDVPLSKINNVSFEVPLMGRILAVPGYPPLPMAATSSRSTTSTCPRRSWRSWSRVAWPCDRDRPRSSTRRTRRTCAAPSPTPDSRGRRGRSSRRPPR